MSSGVRIGEKGALAQSGGQAEGRLKITVAIWNEPMQRWETPNLNNADNLKVEKAVETIRQLGANAAAWQAFNHEDAVLEMTEEGIYVQKEGKWENLLVDQTVEKSVSEKVHKTLNTAVTTILGGKKKSIKASREVAANATALKHGNVVIQVEVTSTPLAASLNDYHALNAEMTEGIGTFVQAYRANREVFEEAMRHQGISDSESAFIFNHYSDLYLALQQWDEDFQKVVNLANSNKSEDALMAFTALIKDALPELLKKVRGANYAAKQFNTPQVQKALNGFANKIGLPNASQIINDLSNVKKIGMAHQLFFDASIEQAREAGINVEEATTALEQLKDHLKTEEDALPEFNRLYEQNQRLIYFFDHKGLMDPMHPFHKEWISILKEYGWTPKIEAIQSFAKRINQYAAYIRPLQQAKHAIEIEEDPIKKRALQVQFKELARQLRPQINRLHLELQKLGGMDRLRLLSRAASKLYSKASKENIMTLQGLQKEADTLVGLMEDRIEYIQELYNDLGLVKPPTGTISQALLHGPHSREPAFLNILRKKKWDVEKIQKLNSWYDAYIKEIYPIDQAKKDLDADPENVSLQKVFKKIVNEQIPKLNALTKEFKVAFGEKQSLEDLEEAIGEYKENISLALPKLEDALKDVGQQNKSLSQQVENYKMSLHMLSKWGISKAFDQNQTFVMEMNRLEHQPMSWDKSFLNQLIPNSSSSLMSYLATGKPLWGEFLKANDVNKEDVKSILGLLNKYQRHLEEIMILERKLELHPEDSKLRGYLINEVSRREQELLSLDQEYNRLAAKITLLEQAIEDFRVKLSNDAELMRLAGEGDEGEMQQAAKKSELAATNLLFILNKLNVLNAFRQKRDFVADVRRRFSSRTVA